MISLCSYRLECRGGSFYVVALEAVPCPLCSEKLLELGRRVRGYVDEDGERESVRIRRMRCSGCLKIHHELPDFLVPYKRHCAQTIESVINDDAGTLRCDAGCAYKLRIWWFIVSAYFAAILNTLKASVGAVFSEPPTFRETIRAVANSNHWRFPGDLSVDLSQPVRN